MSLTPGMLVRISPAFRNGLKSPHFGRAFLVSIGKKTAVIKPLGRHRKTERVPLAAVRAWKSKSRIEHE